MQEKPFGKWRQRLWPIYSFELKKFLPIFFLKFLISLNYSIVNNLKDAIVVTAKKSGAEIIPAVKGFVVLPFAILYTIVFAKLSNHFKRSTLFYGIVSFFALFYLVYGFFIYPNADTFAPHAFADFLTGKIGSQYQHYIALFRYWMHALFFMQSEMWAGVVIFLLYWGFTNQVLKLAEAKRFYALFAAAGNLATMLAGILTMKLARHYTNYLQNLQSSLLIFVAICILMMLLYFWINKYALEDKRYRLSQEATAKSETRTRLNLKESFLYIVRSKYLLAIALMVICYSLTINIVEIVWKAHLKTYYPSAGAFQAFISQVNSLSGLAALFVAFFVSGNAVRFLGWQKSALICPVFIGFTGVSFLFLILNYKLASLLFASPAFLITIYGAFQNLSTKALKYALFDPTKEMAFIPLDRESQVKGKAAIDVVGSRLGKSGSSYLQMLLLFAMGTGSILNAASLILPIVAIAVTSWILAVRAVGKKVEGRESKA